MMDSKWYFALTFIAIVGLQSIPRFLFEVNKPLLIFPRLILLLIFFAVAWFFTIGMHEKFRWGMLSGMFFVDALTAVTLGIFLFMQLYSPYFVYVGLVVLAIRAMVYSHIVSHRLPHLRGLVFTTCSILLMAGEAILIAARF